MATINLLPRKEFEITLSDGTVIKGQFGTWSLKRFCDKLGYSLADAGVKLGNPGLNDVVEFILTAVEYSARKESKPFSYTDIHCCDWIDEIGGLESPEFVKLFNHSSGTVADGGEEKKTTD